MVMTGTFTPAATGYGAVAGIRAAVGDITAPVPPTPVVRTEPALVSLWACSLVGARDPIVEFTTVDLGDVTVAQFGLDEQRHDIRVASSDPAWRLLAAHFGVDVGVGAGWLAARVDWQLWVDGELVADGLSDGPIEPAGGVIDLRVAGGGQILRDRTLGYRQELGFDGDPDVWGQAGRWITPTIPSGWTAAGTWHWDDGPDVPPIFARSLKFTGILGNSLITSTYSVLAPADWSRTYRLRVFLRTAHAVFVSLDTRSAVSGGGWSDWTRETVGVSARGMPINGWQAVEVEQTVGPAPTGAAWQVRAVISATAPFEIGGMTLHRDQPMFEGGPRSPEAAITKILNVGQGADAGGNLGIVRVAGEPSGITAHYALDRLDNPSLPQALKTVADTPGGPDMWFEPGRRLHHSKRAGTNRYDLAFNRDTVIDATVETDTSRQWHSVRAQTGWAAGPAEPVIKIDQAPPDGQIQRQTTTAVPAGLDYAAAHNAAAAQADHLVLPSQSVHVTVTPAIAKQVVLGDCIRVILDIDGWHIDEWLRVGRIVWHPDSDLYTIELGADMLTRGIEDLP